MIHITHTGSYSYSLSGPPPPTLRKTDVSYASLGWEASPRGGKKSYSNSKEFPLAGLLAHEK